MATVTGSTEAEPATVGGKGRVTIPKAVRERLGLSKGDRVLFSVTAEGRAEVVPLEQVPRDQVWFYSKEMRRRVAKAEDDIAMGRTTRAETPQGAQEHLDGLKDESG